MIGLQVVVFASVVVLAVCILLYLLAILLGYLMRTPTMATSGRRKEEQWQIALGRRAEMAESIGQRGNTTPSPALAPVQRIRLTHGAGPAGRDH